MPDDANDPVVQALTAKAPYEDRLKIWQFVQAMDAFACAYEAAVRLSKKQVDSHGFEDLTLVTMFIVCYARPFTQSIQFDEELVPEKRRTAHGEIIALRDKAFAHTDPRGQFDHGGEISNEITLDADQFGVISFGHGYLFPDAEEFQVWLELAGEMNAIAVGRAKETVGRCLGWPLQLDVGFYKINLSRRDDQVLIPARP